MNKKHDEGYALVFVLVVMVVLSIIAISLMSAALKNLQAQTASVERMQDKYVAEGMIEIAELALRNGLTPDNTMDTVLIKDKIIEHLYSPIDLKIKTALTAAVAQIEDIGPKECKLTWILAAEEDGGWVFDSEENGSRIVTIEATYGSANVECSIKLENIIKHTTEEANTTQDKWNYVVPSFKYMKYSIGITGGGS